MTCCPERKIANPPKRRSDLTSPNKSRPLPFPALQRICEIRTACLACICCLDPSSQTSHPIYSAGHNCVNTEELHTEKAVAFAWSIVLALSCFPTCRLREPQRISSFAPAPSPRPALGKTICPRRRSVIYDRRSAQHQHITSSKATPGTKFWCQNISKDVG